jgi:hypothetical protein
LWCLSSSGDHPWIYLVKFGDIQNMKSKSLNCLLNRRARAEGS